MQLTSLESQRYHKRHSSQAMAVHIIFGAASHHLPRFDATCNPMRRP